MTALPQSEFLSEKDYLAFERESDIRHEYMDGRIFPRNGVPIHHAIITANLIGQISIQLRKTECIVYSSLMRVKITLTSNYTYPDACVVCGQQDMLTPDTHATLLNPTLIVEVLSPSTEAYDRGKKFREYRQITSLREYVLVAQDAPRMERFSRNADDTWTLTIVEGMDARLRFDSVDVELALEDVFEGVAFKAG